MLKNEKRTFFFSFFFFFFLLFTFQTVENLFWGYQNGNFLLGKSISRQEKNQENDFAPSEKFSCYAPDQSSLKLGKLCYEAFKQEFL